MNKLERTTSGVPGLDELMGGGFIKGSINMVAGSTGTCKTILCSHFIWEGLKKGENGLYVTLEESADDIVTEAGQFGMAFDKYIKEKKCVIDYIFPKTFADLYHEVFKRIREVNAKRFVLDSLSLAAMYTKADISDLREKMFFLFQKLKKSGITSLIISEIPEGSKHLSRLGFEEFVVDSVIVLHYMEYAAGGTPRSLVVRKMRKSKHGADIYPFEITDKGIVVKKT